MVDKFIGSAVLCLYSTLNSASNEADLYNRTVLYSSVLTNDLIRSAFLRYCLHPVYQVFLCTVKLGTTEVLPDQIE